MARDGDGALHIAELALPSGGAIGLTHLPGRDRRDLGEDLTAIEAWGAAALVTLVEVREFARYGVPGFAEAAATRRFAWHHWPMADMGLPDAIFAAAWDHEGHAVLARLERGERVVLHCAAGLGRTGMIAARLLTELGLAPEAAISRVRAVRPGAIETAAQESFVLTRAGLGSSRSAHRR